MAKVTLDITKLRDRYEGKWIKADDEIFFVKKVLSIVSSPLCTDDKMLRVKGVILHFSYSDEYNQNYSGVYNDYMCNVPNEEFWLSTIKVISVEDVLGHIEKIKAKRIKKLKQIATKIPTIK